VSQPVRIRVDRSLCVGSGTCVGTDPARFRMEEGRAAAVDDEHDLDDDLIDAIDGCPVAAITAHDPATDEVIR
jgi:ferredoxin